ncbi:MAG: hypothetical protein MJB14_16525, partial [Spirochaetes bacterium]|nr:hypothetical protein [Spirochaetota bacterium]
KKNFYPVFLYYKNMIQVRKEHPLLRINSQEVLNNQVQFVNNLFPIEKSRGIAYTIDNHHQYNDHKKLLILINPYDDDITIHLHEQHWKVKVWGDHFHFSNYPDIWGENHLPANSGFILFQS